MKTRQEMQLEARRIEEIGQQLLEDRRRGSRSETALNASGPRLVVFTFPDTSVRFNEASEFEGPLTHRRVRRIEFVANNSEAEYKLTEEEFVSSDEGELITQTQPVTLVMSDDPMDVVLAGHQRVESDLLHERLEPVINRLEANTFPEPVTRNAVREVEQLVSDLSLSPGAKLRVKSDAIAFLEGSLDSRDFVARTIARQDCYEPNERMSVAQRMNETIEVS